MDEKLEKKLFKKYPELFKQKDLSMKETAMVWGFQFGNGWYEVMNQLCSWLDWNIKQNGHIYPAIEFNTCKEKFGILRLYWDTTDKYVEGQSDGYHRIDGAISFAESLSATVCEECGLPGKLYSVNGWYLTICMKCLKKYVNERKKNWKDTKMKFKIIDCSEEKSKEIILK